MGDDPVEKSSSDGADVLKIRLRELLGSAEKQREMAALTGFPQPTLKDWGSGRSAPAADKLERLARAARRPVGWFFSDDGLILPPATGATVLVPLMNVRASAGPGCAADVVRAIEEIEMPRSFLRKIGGEGARLECLRASGSSMAPTILDGALLIIDRNRKPPAYNPPPRKTRRRPQQQDMVYVFYQGQDLRLKRLRALPHEFMAVISDNIAENPIEIFKPGEDGAFAVQGAVVWWDNRL